jgi:hypothetical protein
MLDMSRQANRQQAFASAWDRSRSAASLPQDATSFALGGPTPDAGLLALRQSEFETGSAHAALLAHLRRDRRVVVVVGIEDARVETSASSEHSPFQFVC